MLNFRQQRANLSCFTVAELRRLLFYKFPEARKVITKVDFVPRFFLVRDSRKFPLHDDKDLHELHHGDTVVAELAT